MAKNLLIILTTIFATSFIKTEGRFLFEDSRVHKLLERGNSKTNDFCTCANYSCSCCITNSNGKGCGVFNVMMLEGKNGDIDYTLEVLVKVEDTTILAEYLNLPNDSIVCYSFDDLGVCGKLVPTKQEDGVQICGILQLSLSNRVVHELKMYCLDIPSRNNKITEVEAEDYKSPRGISSDEDTETERQKKKKKDKKETTERPPIIPPMPFIPFIPWSP